MTAVAFVLDLAALEHCSDLTPEVLVGYAQAAAVTLERFHSVPPPDTATSVRDDAHEFDAGTRWSAPTDRERRTHANDLDAIRDGAYALGILALDRRRRLRVIARTQHGSGADFVAIAEGADENAFIHVEVSGTGQADPAEVPKRLALKRAQVGNGVAIVVGFHAPAVVLQGVP